MPAKSRAQYRFMQAVAHGTAKKKPKGLSKREAKEYVKGQSPKGLPEKKSNSNSKPARSQLEKRVARGLKKAFPKGKHAGLTKRRAARKKYEHAAKTSKPGEGKRFAAVKASAKAGGAENPGAVAAAIGRKKYGKARFQKMAAAGRRKG